MSYALRFLAIGFVLAGVCLSGIGAAHPQDQPKLQLSEQEKKILDLTNEAREKEKKPPLKPNPVLFEVARAHSANMAKKGEMNHVLDGKNPAQRLKAAGYDYSWTSENIASGDTDWPLSAVMKTWMESQIHRDNILSDKVTEIGIGIAKDSKGEVYYTQVFAAPKKKP